MYNTHIHTFRDIDVPVRFLPLQLVRILSTTVGFNLIAKLLNNLNPFSDDDIFKRYLKFITTGKMGSQQKIFEECKKYYPDNCKFVILPMDMAYMEAGKVPRKYELQLRELSELKLTYPNQVVPFVHVDPRRPGVESIVKHYTSLKGFAGIKIYPPLGIFPYDKRLYPIYEYCQANDLPVMTHCSPYNPVHFKGSKKQLRALLADSKTPIETKGKSVKELCSNFTNPLNWKYVMEDFPKLRICAAHFGSEYYWDRYLDDPSDAENWFTVVKDMIRQHENFYTDVSFTANNTKYFSLLKVLLTHDDINEKILFGSDYYMIETKTTERRFSLDLRAYLGEYQFELIADKNPKKFLGTTDK